MYRRFSVAAPDRARPPHRRGHLRRRRPAGGHPQAARHRRGQAGPRPRLRRRPQRHRPGPPGRQGDRRRRVGRPGRARPGPRASARSVRVELHHGPLAELAFLRADTIDACVSAFGLAPVADIDRVFRQVHRVLRPEMPLVLSLPHPAFALADPDDPSRSVQRSYWDSAPISADEARAVIDVPRTISGAVHEPRPGQLPRRHRARAGTHAPWPPQPTLDGPDDPRPGHADRASKETGDLSAPRAHSG